MPVNLPWEQCSCKMGILWHLRAESSQMLSAIITLVNVNYWLWYTLCRNSECMCRDSILRWSLIISPTPDSIHKLALLAGLVGKPDGLSSSSSMTLSLCTGQAGSMLLTLCRVALI